MLDQTQRTEATAAAAPDRPILAELRRDNFNAIRLALAIGVLFSHSFPMLGLPEPVVMGRSLGNFCVHVFFALSGYMITQSFMRSRSLGRYVLHRGLRIIPALFVAMLFSRVLASYFANYAANPMPGIINGPVWTIPWEVVCYILVAMAGILGILAKESFKVFLAAVLVYAFAGADLTNESYLVLTPLMLVFAGGSFLAIYEHSISIGRAAIHAACAAFLVQTEGSLHLVQQMVDSIPWPYGPGNGYFITHSILYLFAVPVLALWLGRYAPPIFAIRNDLSYGTYLYAWPVQQAIVALSAMMGLVLHPLALFVVALAGTLLLAWPSWVLIERPALRLKGLNHRQVSRMLAWGRRT